MAIVLVVGSVLLLVSAFAWVARRDTVERARALTSLRYTPLAEVKERKLTAVRAKAVAEEPIVDPVTQQRVVFHEARLVRVDREERTLRNLREGSIVRLDDGGGAVDVHLQGADLVLPWEELEACEGEPSPLMRKLLEDAMLPVPATERGARYAIVHRAIRVGDAITVVGRPSFEQRTPSIDGYRGGTQAAARFVADEEGLVVTDGELEGLQERERGDLRAMTRMLQIAALLGLMMVGLGAALMLRG